MAHDRSSLLCGAAALALCSVLCPQTAQAAWPYYPEANLPVCTAANHQIAPAIVSDGAGGAIVTWQDARSVTDYDVYAQHVLASGALDAGWPTGDLALCTAAGSQERPSIVSDGAGGAIAAWHDYRNGLDADVYAQRVLASGAVDPAWPGGGRALCTASSHQEYTAIVSDGTGGAIVTWQDYRNGNYDIYAQHVFASGARDTSWPPNGSPLCTAVNDQRSPAIVSDGAGGAIVTWFDGRNGAGDDNVYAQHVLATGAPDPAWPTDGRALCTAANDQRYPTIVSDGAGGAVIAWQDARGGVADIYAQHVTAAGAVDWPPDGVALCTAGNSQLEPQLISDDTGGAIVTWRDKRNGSDNEDIYAQHVTNAGAADPAWPADGVALCSAANDQVDPRPVSDGAGGAIIAWLDDRRTGSLDYEIYAQHVTAAGAVDASWPADGIALCTAIRWRTGLRVVSDGVAGAIVAWSDYRSGTDWDIYAQRVERFGRLGSPEPAITNVRDVPDDQGGKVRIRWSASYLDTLPTLETSLYGIWHQVTEATALAAERGGRRLLRPDDRFEQLGPGTFVRVDSETQSTYWEGLGTVAACGNSTYTFLAVTLQDSTASSNPYSVFMVDAHGAFRPGFWCSAPDSGYSVDNLAPAPPTPFTGEYANGTATLHWGRNTEPDFARYHLHRGSTADFVPDPSNLVVAQSDTGCVDHAGAPYHYKLGAADVHGNLSAYTYLLPSGALDVPGAGLPRRVWLARPSPNPMREGCAVHFGLPSAGHITLAVYDQQGRRVRTLADAAMAAGEHMLPWDGRDAGGHTAPSGLYFVRLATGKRTLTVRVVVVR